MIELRAWEPEDTMTLLSWVDASPRMLKQMGFLTRTALVEYITTALTSSNARILAAEQDGEMVGYLAAINCQSDGSGMCHIGTSPKHRGLGVEVMEAGIETAFNGLGLTTLIAMVNKDRRGRAIEKWDRQFGFKEPGAKILVLTKAEWELRDGNRA